MNDKGEYTNDETGFEDAEDNSSPPDSTESRPSGILLEHGIATSIITTGNPMIEGCNINKAPSNQGLSRIRSLKDATTIVCKMESASRPSLDGSAPAPKRVKIEEQLHVPVTVPVASMEHANINIGEASIPPDTIPLATKPQSESITQNGSQEGQSPGAASSRCIPIKSEFGSATAPTAEQTHGATATSDVSSRIIGERNVTATHVKSELRQEPSPSLSDSTPLPLVTTGTQDITLATGSTAVSAGALSDGATSNKILSSTIKAAPLSPLRTTDPPASYAPPSSPLPLKATTMLHLKKKYTTELQYMLREFKKLERQLLGAKGNGSGIEESSGSRERREKLHSFILHLEDTIRQIELGCQLESEGKSTVMVGVSSTTDGIGSANIDAEAKKIMTNSAALTKLTKEKGEEENVQKLEEHILANLLPVKVRLTKQLAAQQGASRNPAGMPTSRRGMLQPAAEQGKGTFAAAAEQRQKQVDAARAAQQESLSSPSMERKSTQFGKPLRGGGSSLTQKLHGTTLGSKKRVFGHGVGSTAPEMSSGVNASPCASTPGDGVEERNDLKNILYAGITPGSEQIQSGVDAATDVHEGLVEPREILAHPGQPKQSPTSTTPDVASLSSSSSKPLIPLVPQHLRGAPPKAAPAPGKSIVPPKLTSDLPSSKVNPVSIPSSTDPVKDGKQRLEDINLTEEEMKKLRRKRRRRKKCREGRRIEMERQRQIMLQQQAAQASLAAPVKAPTQAPAGKKATKVVVTKGSGKKNGPRSVEYICSLCSESYGSTCDYNPWWGLTSHECPKCRKSQIPRIDIAALGNQIEYHPALLAHAEDSSGANASGGGSGGAAVNAGGGMSIMHINPSHMAPNFPMNATFANGKFLKYGSDSDSGSDLSGDSDSGMLSDNSYYSDDSDTDLQSLSPAEQAENEKFGKEYNGPTLTASEASRLLTLMGHASTCLGRHKSAKHRDTCHSTKYLMLHVRDCPGTTASLDICPFPWCRKVKHLLYHLVSCTQPKTCSTCTPLDLSSNLTALVGLNKHRRQKQRERMKVAMAATAKAKPPPLKPTSTMMQTTKPRRPAQLLKSTAPIAAAKPPYRRPAVPSTTSSSTISVAKLTTGAASNVVTETNATRPAVRLAKSAATTSAQVTSSVGATPAPTVAMYIRTPTPTSASVSTTIVLPPTEDTHVVANNTLVPVSAPRTVPVSQTVATSAGVAKLHPSNLLSQPEIITSAAKIVSTMDCGVASPELSTFGTCGTAIKKEIDVALPALSSASAARVKAEVTSVCAVEKIAEPTFASSVTDSSKDDLSIAILVSSVENAAPVVAPAAASPVTAVDIVEDLLSPKKVDSSDSIPIDTFMDPGSPSTGPALMPETSQAPLSKVVLLPSSSSVTNVLKESASNIALNKEASSATLIEDNASASGNSEAENECGRNTPNNVKGISANIKSEENDSQSTGTDGIVTGDMATTDTEKGTSDETGDDKSLPSTAAPSPESNTSCSEEVVKNEDPVRISC